MSSDATPGGGEPDEVRYLQLAIEDELANRIVPNIHITTRHRQIVVEMSGQYRRDTADEIVCDEVEPILPDEWTVSAITSPVLDVDYTDPRPTHCLNVLPIIQRRVAGVKHKPNTTGIVADGLEDWIDDWKLETRDIPSTYAAWDKFADEEDGYDGNGVLNGAIGVSSDGGDAIQYLYDVTLVRAALKVLNGKGRYNSDDYELHLGVPLAVLEGAANAIVISPITRTMDADDVHYPAFTYSSGVTSSNFKLVN